MPVPAARLCLVVLASACSGVFAGDTPPATLEPMVFYGAGLGSRSVATGDVNGDGALDLVVGNGFVPGSGVSLLTGMGDGTFGPPTLINTTTRAGGVLLGDFDGDGATDVAVCDDVSPAGRVLVLLGAGDGTFAPAIATPVGSGPTELRASDLNGDGALDLVVLNAGSADASVLLGDGDGTFQPETRVTGFGTPAGLGMGDFNSDGVADIVLSSETGLLALRLGNGSGAFGSPQILNIGGFTSLGVHTSDLDADGNDDLVITSHTGTTINVLFGTGAGTFSAPVLVATTTATPRAICVDVNADTIPDIVGLSEAADRASVILSNGDRTFRPGVLVVTSDQPRGGAYGDFNGDGAPDIAIACAGAGGVSVLLNATSFVPRFVEHPAVNTLVEAGADVTLSVSFIGAPSPSVVWRRDGEPVVGGVVMTGANTSMLMLSGVGADDEQYYDAVLTNSAGSVISTPSLLAVLGAGGGGEACAGDADDSGVVDFNDLVATLFLFGPCP